MYSEIGLPQIELASCKSRSLSQNKNLKNKMVEKELSVTVNNRQLHKKTKLLKRRLFS